MRRRERKNQRGVAALEFALISPLLLALLFGGFGAFMAYRQAASLQTTTATLADLLSRQTSIEADLGEELTAAARAMLVTADTGRAVEIGLLAISRPADDEEPDERQILVVDWYHAAQSDGQAASLSAASLLAAVEVPVLTRGEGVVIVHLQGQFDFSIGTASLHDFGLRRYSLRRPRYVARLLPAG